MVAVFRIKLRNCLEKESRQELLGGPIFCLTIRAHPKGSVQLRSGSRARCTAAGLLPLWMWREDARRRVASFSQVCRLYQ